MTAYEKRQKILNEAGPAWRFRCAVGRFERSIRNVEAHIQKHGATPLPEWLWAEEKIARRELMALCPKEPTP